MAVPDTANAGEKGSIQNYHERFYQELYSDCICRFFLWWVNWEISREAKKSLIRLTKRVWGYTVCCVSQGCYLWTLQVQLSWECHEFCRKLIWQSSLPGSTFAIQGSWFPDLFSSQASVFKSLQASFQLRIRAWTHEGSQSEQSLFTMQLAIL